MPGSEQILLDILEHDWKEAQDDRQDLCQKLNSLQSELQWAEELRDKVKHPSPTPSPLCSRFSECLTLAACCCQYLQEVEDLQLKYRTLQKDCDLYKHRMNTVLLQLEEIEKERDQVKCSPPAGRSRALVSARGTLSFPRGSPPAVPGWERGVCRTPPRLNSQPGSLQAIQSRDGVQLQYSQSLIEKDQYRKRVRTLEEERDELLSKLSQAEGLNSTLEAQLQRCRGNRSLGKVRLVGWESTARKAGLNFWRGRKGMTARFSPRCAALPTPSAPTSAAPGASPTTPLALRVGSWTRWGTLPFRAW